MKFYKEVLSHLESELEQLELENLNRYNCAEKAIALCRDSLRIMRERVLKKGFKDAEMECEFFKVVKPKVVGHLIHFINLVKMERHKPIGRGKEVHKFYMDQVAVLRRYFVEHQELYEYYNRGHSHHDLLFFSRNAHSPDWYRANITSIVDTNFSTPKDMILAKILGNTRTINYLEHKMARKNTKAFSNMEKKTTLKWTGTKVDLVELVYALQASNMINNGNVGIKELAKDIEHLFSIELGDYYRIFLEIRTRKSNQSKLLDLLKISLINKIAEADD
ncbi:MAG: RteC domain-containing protein [Aequorivita sp.]|nr:RteC domain-containing protein [Aequorivita sp.]